MSWSYDLRQLRPWLIPLAVQLLEQSRAGLLITSVVRSPALQARLYRRRQMGLHPYPVAPPGSSLHEYGLAWDMTGPPEELRRLGAVWQRMGGRYGGARDPIHFEAGPAMLRAHRDELRPRIGGVSVGQRAAAARLPNRRRRSSRRRR